MLDTLKECPYYLISRVSLSVTAALKKEFASSGAEQVKPAYLCVLMSLWQQDGLKVIELSKQAGLEPSTMTGLLDRMERDGLVVRSADLNDRRAQRIFLTDSGREVKSPVLDIVERTFDTVFENIAENELSLLKDILRRVLRVRAKINS
jgi:DNA-binding MarR family transcriptional regulator